MGEMADAIINGDFDEITGEYIGEGQGFPRTYVKGHYNTISKNKKKHKKIHANNNIPNDWNKEKFAKGTKAIRAELAILIKNTIKENPDKNENAIVNDCRKEINLKYGKGWREQF